MRLARFPYDVFYSQAKVTHPKIPLGEILLTKFIGRWVGIRIPRWDIFEQLISGGSLLGTQEYQIVISYLEKALGRDG